jgi:hypothetical protein
MWGPKKISSQIPNQIFSRFAVDNLIEDSHVDFQLLTGADSENSGFHLL